MTARSIHWSTYLIAGVLVLISLLGTVAVFCPLLDCPRCAKPRGGFNIHICRKGRVSYFQRWMMSREPEQPPSRDWFSP